MEFVKDLISIRDLEKKHIDLILKKSSEMEQALKEKKKLSSLGGKVVATLFFEPSTRTRLSFQSAAMRLGAKVLSFENVGVSSIVKGETFSDTIRMVDGYSDLIVVRHANEGSARYAAQLADHPVINGGDGGNQHPTQTLLDMYTIKRAKKKIEGLNVTLLGDLKHARTMRSLMHGLGMYGANVTLIAPKGLEMSREVINEVKDRFGAKVEEKSKMDFSGADVLYLCRIQKERFSDQYEAEKVQKEFRITADAIKGVKDDLIIMHPLPKVDEVAPEVDQSKYAYYYEQARMGIPVRMAIMDSMVV
ncbi:MAG: Aspartate carbamoyltransferase catalytic subunit [Candidatus Fermentimicrarchaeum limneticum]|uniref:Aspartate carbamoyltransferase n=1 Tax=Fermentimicrarchaeum limneticum TaxID=2795018 RepID=A0A7D5XCR7_FERL1|nr:MAG: Aspartate carbamoyltransferase catalytic subunit [Candidatus Fermentimicrarchaeum limneticum]